VSILGPRARVQRLNLPLALLIQSLFRLKGHTLGVFIILTLIIGSLVEEIVFHFYSGSMPVQTQLRLEGWVTRNAIARIQVRIRYSQGRTQPLVEEAHDLNRLFPIVPKKEPANMRGIHTKPRSIFERLSLPLATGSR